MRKKHNESFLRAKHISNSSTQMDPRFNQFEVSPTFPGPGDKERRKEVSNAITEYKADRVKAR